MPKKKPKKTTCQPQFKLLSPGELQQTAVPPPHPAPQRPHNFNRSNYKPKRFYKVRTFLGSAFRYLCTSCCCFCGAHYKHDIRTGRSSGSSRKRGRFQAICCPPWNCFPFCCCVRRPPNPSAFQSSEDICNLIRNCGNSQADDIDIDQYVARYRQSEQLRAHSLSSPGSVAAGTGSIALTAVTSGGAPQPKTPNSSQTTTPEVHKRGKKKIIKHIWNWNDSLKSNSDKFLESLEYDAVNGNGGGGSKSNSLKKYRKIPNNCSDIEGTWENILLT